MTLTPLQTPAVSLKGVKKTYRGFQLGPMALTIEPGCVVAVVGPNGAERAPCSGS